MGANYKSKQMLITELWAQSLSHSVAVDFGWKLIYHFAGRALV